jgi:hypothetical protein
MSNKLQPGFAVARAATPHVDKSVPTPKLWTFGFRFFRQIKFFGLNRTDSGWFVSFLEKLTEISSEDIDEFLSNMEKRNAWRFHDVNWNLYNVPIRRSDLNWLPNDILSNAEEFPIHQFQISKALGRVAGFFDPEQVFQIVLLDPWHNLQPSKAHNYRVSPCDSMSCDYTRMREEILNAAELAACSIEECPVRTALRAIDRKPDQAYGVILLKPEDQVVRDAYQLISEGRAASYEELFCAGILCHLVHIEPDKESATVIEIGDEIL